MPNASESAGVGLVNVVNKVPLMLNKNAAPEL